MFYVLEPAEARLTKPSNLPANVQTMIFEYFDQHLPDEIKTGTAQKRKEDGRERGGDDRSESIRVSETER